MEPLNLKFLDRSGIDDQYFLKKDILIHTTLQSVLTMHDGNRNTDLQVYSGRKTSDLVKQYGDYVKKLDVLYNKMLLNEQVFLVRLVQNNDIQLAQKAGYFPDAMFTVFKDELLNVSSSFMLSFMIVDPKTFLQESLN